MQVPWRSAVELGPKRAFINFAWRDYTDFNDQLKSTYDTDAPGLIKADPLLAFRAIKRQAITMRAAELCPEEPIDAFEHFSTITALQEQLAAQYAPEPLNQKVSAGFVATSIVRCRAVARVFQVGPTLR